MTDEKEIAASYEREERKSVLTDKRRRHLEMYADKTENDELREEYKRSDFPGPLIRGKYARRLNESSDTVVLRPEVAEIFSNERNQSETDSNVNLKLSMR